VIGANIELRSVSIEVARNAPVLFRLDIQAPWLNEIREDQRDGVSGTTGIFKPDRTLAIETDNKR
jgi:hypothetical protein